MQKLFEFKDVEYMKRDKEYVNGQSFMYLGRNYSLQLIEDKSLKKPVVKLYQGKFYIETDTRNQEILKQAMEDWYRKKTLEKVIQKVDYYKDSFKIKPRIIKVKQQKKR